MESNGYRPLTSLGLYRGPQQQSILQLGAHALGHDSGQVCPRGVGMGAGGAGGGLVGAILGVGEQQAGVHCGAHEARQDAGHADTGEGEGGSRIIMGGGGDSA